MQRLTLIALGCLALGLLVGFGPDAPDNKHAASARATAEAYLEGFLDADAEVLEELLHYDWQMSGMTPNGQYFMLLRDDYLDRVREAAAREDRTAYTGRVADVVVHGSVAIATFEIESDRAAFVECLSMVRTEAGWRVVQKIFDVTMK
ncbi:MAG: nuclear transport factor 2 family protein [Phycisphaerales bacterium]